MGVRVNRVHQLLTVGFGLGLAATAWAYILPDFSLVRKMEQKREDQHIFSLVVDGSFTFTGPAAQSMAQKIGRFAEGGELSVPAVASYKMSGRCRIELAPKSAKPGEPKSFASYRNGVLAQSPDMQSASILLELACPLLASRGGDNEVRSLVAWAKSGGISFATTSLSRANSALAQVIGAGPHDSLKAQLWIDKDNFVPLRVIMKKNGTWYDVRFDPGVGILESHPQTIELWQMGQGVGGEQLLARFSAEKLMPNAQVGDALFP